MTSIYFNYTDSDEMSDSVRRGIIKYLNESQKLTTDYQHRSARVLEKFRKYIYEYLKITDIDDEDGYHIIFNSGTSEGNNYIIHSIINANKRQMGKSSKNPHVILSAYEHKSLIGCASLLAQAGDIDISLVHPDENGIIQLSEIERKIKKETALISVIGVHHELGIVNDLSAIGELAHTRAIPFHTDACQMFGKFESINMDYIDILTTSFHKIGGPVGCGIIVIKNALLDGYSLAPQIYGSENYGYRGGKINIPYLAGSYLALKNSIQICADRETKTLQLKEYLLSQLKKSFKLFYFNKICENSDKLTKLLSFFKSEKEKSNGKNKQKESKQKESKQKEPIMLIYPNTVSFIISFSILPGIGMKSSEILSYFDEHRIHLSVGCENNSQNIHHVLDSLFRNVYKIAVDQDIDSIIIDKLLEKSKNNFIKLSFSEKNNKQEIIKFISLLNKI